MSSISSCILRYRLKITNWNREWIVPRKPPAVQIALSKFITKVLQIDLPFIDKLQSHFLRSLNGRKSPAISGIQTKLYPEHGPLAARVPGCRVRGLQVQSGVELSIRAILISSIWQNSVLSAALVRHPQIQAGFLGRTPWHREIMATKS